MGIRSGQQIAPKQSRDGGGEFSGGKGAGDSDRHAPRKPQEAGPKFHVAGIWEQGRAPAFLRGA